MCNYRKDFTQIAIRISAASILHRKQFNLANKDINESLEDWYNRLSELAEACEYDYCLDAFLLHQFICGLEDSILEVLTAENRNLSFTDIVDLIRNYERSKEPVIVKPEIKEEGIPSSDDDYYNDNSIDCVDDNEPSYEDNIETMVPFVAETHTESEPPQSILPVQSFQPVSSIKPVQSIQPLQLSKPISDTSNPFECYLCHKSWATIGKLKYHIIEFHTTGKTVTCYLCGRFVKDPSNMVKHLNFHFNLKRFQCDLCDLAFVTRQSLKKHLVRHDSAKAGSFKCSSCEKTFISQRHLKIHTKTHKRPEITLSEKLDWIDKKRKSSLAKSKANVDKTPIKCEICAASFDDEGSRENHMKVHSETEWLCHLCGKKLKIKRNLINHYRVHNNEKPFKCSGCDLCFASKEKLKLHSKTHSGSRPHICSICNKSFLQKGHLEAHVKGHSKLKCDYCKKAYVNEEKYQKHLLEHAAAKPNVCTVCNKVFKYKSFLTEHERIHTGERAYVCSICGSGFKLGSTLRKHIKRHAKPPRPKSGPKRKRKPKVEKAIADNELSIQPTTPHFG